MRSLTTEFKVGLFVLVAIAMVVAGWAWTFDGVRQGEQAYTVTVTMKSADGVFEGTPVKLAGVAIGSVSAIDLEGDRAKVSLLIREAYQLPLDSTVRLRSSGLLGDYYLAITPGRDEALLGEAGVLVLDEEPADIDAVIRQVELIAEDVKAITGALRVVAENDANREALEATLANIAGTSAELQRIVTANSRDVDAIVDTIDRLTRSLEAFANETAADVDTEMDKVHDATDTLQQALDDVSSITGKVDEGRGTIGALVNDDTTVAALNETIDNANDVIESFSGLRAEVFYEGRLYRGTQPNDSGASFLGNPLGNTSSNTIGVNLYPQEDFWWTFSINDYPLGTLQRTETFNPDTGSVLVEWERQPNYRLTFMMNKRWGDFSFRLGVKETGGGVGLTWWALDDRLQIWGDIWDFEFGSYPFMEAAGTPNTRLVARIEPMKGIYGEVGTEQVLLGARYGYFTGFVGLGFRFDDDDIKLLLASLPLNF